jgi:hypothetical protein
MSYSFLSQCPKLGTSSLLGPSGLCSQAHRIGSFPKKKHYFFFQIYNTNSKIMTSKPDLSFHGGIYEDCCGLGCEPNVVELILRIRSNALPLSSGQNSRYNMETVVLIQEDKA